MVRRVHGRAASPCSPFSLLAAHGGRHARRHGPARARRRGSLRVSPAPPLPPRPWRTQGVGRGEPPLLPPRLPCAGPRSLSRPRQGGCGEAWPPRRGRGRAARRNPRRRPSEAGARGEAGGARRGRTARSRARGGEGGAVAAELGGAGPPRARRPPSLRPRSLRSSGLRPGGLRPARGSGGARRSAAAAGAGGGREGNGRWRAPRHVAALRTAATAPALARGNPARNDADRFRECRCSTFLR